MSTQCEFYQERKCWKHVEMTEEHIKCNRDCSKCSFGEYNDISTMANVRKIYSSIVKNRCRPKTANCRLSIFDRFIDFMGGDDKKAIFDDNTPYKFIQYLKDDGVSDQTIKSYLENVSAIFGNSSSKMFKQQGLNIQPFPKYDFKVVKNRWVSLTRDQRSKIRQYQFDCYNLSDPRKYLCVTGAWERGARKSDVLRFNWNNNFIMMDGVVWWNYVTNKTHKVSEWPIDPDTWMMLCSARKKLDSLHVQHLGKYPDSYLRLRRFSEDDEATSEIWTECGKDLREIMGWNSSKSMHNLRKDATDQVFQNMGIDEACEFSSDTEKVIKDHYAGKKKINPRTISIAKM